MTILKWPFSWLFICIILGCLTLLVAMMWPVSVAAKNPPIAECGEDVGMYISTARDLHQLALWSRAGWPEGVDIAWVL